MPRSLSAGPIIAPSASGVSIPGTGAASCPGATRFPTAMVSRSLSETAANPLHGEYPSSVEYPGSDVYPGRGTDLPAQTITPRTLTEASA